MLTQELPKYKDKIFVVVTKEQRFETVAITEWNNHIYLLVSAALLARPIDEPTSELEKSWKWLIKHEVNHIKQNHLLWIVISRQLHKLSSLSLAIASIFFREFSTIFVILFLTTWFFQAAVSFTSEILSDKIATLAIDDISVLEAVKKTLIRMNAQVANIFPQPIGYIYYFLISIINATHPPLFLRQWILNKRMALLRK